MAGDACISHCSQSGMLSSGVDDPESRFMVTITGITSRPNCGIERAIMRRTISAPDNIQMPIGY